jgi:NADPH:quinone reductase-like Zn-dependent oxidoreductase
MKAIIRSEYGSPDVLRLVDAALPEPGPKQVRVTVEAAGVDIGAWHLMAGLPTMVRPALGLPRPRRQGLGTELAGVVDAVGSEVTRFRSGDRVFGIGSSGTFAEFALAAEKNLVPRSPGVGAEAAAASAVSAVTAVQALASLKPGDRVLVLGASGGVGSFAAQIATARGAHVTGVASTAKLDLVRGLGVDEVVDYTVADPTDGSKTYDLILEMGGIRPWAVLRRALVPGGRAVIVGGEGGGRVTGGFLKNLIAAPASVFHSRKIVGLVSTTNVETLTAVDTMLADGSLKPVIEKVYPLAETADALRRLEAHRVRGKLVISPSA